MKIQKLIFMSCALIVLMCDGKVDENKSKSSRNSDFSITAITVSGCESSTRLQNRLITIQTELEPDALDTVTTITAFNGEKLEVEGTLAEKGVSINDFTNSKTQPLTFTVYGDSGKNIEYQVIVLPTQSNVTNQEDDTETIEVTGQDLLTKEYPRIQAIQFHGVSVDDEYIEITNPSTSQLSLNKTDSAEDDIRLYRMTKSGTISRIFSFPEGALLAPGETVRIANDNSSVFQNSDYHFADKDALISSTEGVILLTMYTCNSGVIIDLVSYGKTEDASLWGALVVDTKGPIYYCSRQAEVGQSGVPLPLSLFWLSDPVALVSASEGIERVDTLKDSDTAADWKSLVSNRN